VSISVREINKSYNSFIFFLKLNNGIGRRCCPGSIKTRQQEIDNSDIIYLGKKVDGRKKKLIKYWLSALEFA
jgi:hypothetical protein